jgi:hypothetical protein
MKRLLLIVLCGAAGFSFACGGTTGVDTNPPPSCPTGAVTLNPTTIAVGGTSTASAPSGFTNGGFTSSDPTVAALSGSTVKGVAAGSATISGSGWTYSNGATGCSLSGAALTVTSPPPAITITSLTPSVFRCDAECQMVTETMLGSGFEVGDTVETVPNAWLQLVQLVSSGESLVTMGLDTPHSSPGSFTFSDCRGTTATCSNTWSVAYTGNQNDLVTSPSGELYNLDRVIGEIWKFKSDGTPDGEIDGASPYGEVSISFDAVDNWVWTNGGTGGSIGFDADTGNAINSTWDANDSSDSASEDGLYCGTEAAAGRLACLATKILGPTFAYAPAGVEPWSLAMLTLGLGTQAQETDAIVYDREGTALYFFTVAPPTSGGTVPTITLKTLPGPPAPPNPLILNGLTPADTLTGTGNGGWDMVRFETGPAVGTVVLFSAYDKALIFVNASTMAETNRVILSLPSGSGTPFRIAADEVNGRVVVALANVGASTSTSFLAVTPAGAVTQLTAIAQDLIAVGLGVSSDGTNIYACMRNQCQALPNQ